MNQNDKNIDYAIIETLRVHPEYSSKLLSLLFDNATSVVNRKNFTRSNGARSFIDEMECKDFIKYVLKKFVILRYYLENNGEELSAGFKNCIGWFNALVNSGTNLFIYFQMNPKDFLLFVSSVVDCSFNSTKFYDSINQSYKIDDLIDFNQRLDEFVLCNEEVINLCNKIEKNYQVVRNMSNLEFNQIAVNKCLNEIVNGRQLVNRHNEYHVGADMYATQDIGNKRINQEDSVLIMSHPNNANFKFLVVSDGMGGEKNGEIASWIVVKKMADWFCTISKDLFDSPEKLQNLFNQKIADVSYDVYKKLKGQGGATFVGAVVCKNQTIISNVGDSRAMTLKWNKLNLVTEDDSTVFCAAKGERGRKLSDKEIDQLRFNRYSNRILKAMGEEELSNIKSYIINNRSYDKLLLFSDGITDLLSMDEIKFISRKTDPELITNTLVHEALRKDAINPNLGSEQEYNRIFAGKDNATAAMYARR